MIFNTSSRAHAPVYVVAASRLCNKSSNTEVPVCLAYDQVHYETLVPDTDDDILKTIALKKEILSGTYSMKMDDIVFLAKTSKLKSYAEAAKSSTQNSKQIKEKNIKETGEKETEQAKLEKLKQLGAKKRSPEQEREYKRLMQQRNRKSKEMEMTGSNIEDKKVKEAERKRNTRAQQSEEMKQKVNLQNNLYKKKLRSTMSDEKKNLEKENPRECTRQLRERRSEREKELENIKQ